MKMEICNINSEDPKIKKLAIEELLNNLKKLTENGLEDLDVDTDAIAEDLVHKILKAMGCKLNIEIDTGYLGIIEY